MPTTFTVSVNCHLSHAPELKVAANERQYCKVSGWTADRVKDKEGNYNKEFTSVEAFISGKQAEWLCKDAKKGSLVSISGSARVRAYMAKDGTPKGVLEFTNVCNATCMDKREEGEQAAPAAPKSAPKSDAGGGAGDSEPPFMRKGEWE